MDMKNIGYHQAYKITGKPGSGGDTKVSNVDKGSSGSHRDNNWKKGAAQAKTKANGKVGPYNNIKDSSGPLY